MKISGFKQMKFNHQKNNTKDEKPTQDRCVTAEFEDKTTFKDMNVSSYLGIFFGP